MRMIKNVVVSAIVIAMTAVNAGETCTVNGIEWNYSVTDGKAAIECMYGLESETLEIPSVLDGYPVEGIGSLAFEGCRMSSVMIPESVKTIGNGAFDGCTKLKSVMIPDGVKTIGYMAFCGCTSLESVSIGKGLASISDSMFEGCSSLAEVTVPENVKVIGELAFAGCESLVSVKNAGGVTVIKRQAFEDCHYLSDFTIGANVESIGVGAFWGCESLKSITVPDNVTSIGYLAFCDCTSLETVVFLGKLPNGMEDSCILDSAMKVYYPETDADSYKSIVPDEKFAGFVTEDIPEVETDAEIAAALLGSADARLAANIKTAAEYGRYRAWASGLAGVSRPEVKKSPNAWLSYALALPELLTSVPKDGDVSIVSFDKASFSNDFSFKVKVKGVEIGDEAQEGNIMKVFDVEGATDLSDSAFSAESVTVETADADNGKVDFMVRPKDSTAKSFFIKVRFRCH